MVNEKVPDCVHSECDDPEWCAGEPKCRYASEATAVAIAYRSLGTRWDGYEHYLVRLSTNEVVERWCHHSMQAPYRGFKMLGDIQQPPRYDASLSLSRPQPRTGEA